MIILWAEISKKLYPVMNIVVAILITPAKFPAFGKLEQNALIVGFL
jgi:hypothetical protein